MSSPVVYLLLACYFLAGLEVSKANADLNVELPLIQDKHKGQKVAVDAAKMLGNLMQSGIQPLAQNPGSSKAILLGEGLPPVSQKLVDKISRGEFVEMRELLPDEWIKEESVPGNHKHRFLDIRVWAMCFASYIIVMANKEPSRVPDLLGYLVQIIKTSLEFDGPAWANYDNTFRRQAAATGNKNWASLNPSLFSICFTDKGRWRSKCDDCLGAGHSTNLCPFRECETEPLFSGDRRGGSYEANSSWPRCQRFNEGKCTFLDCSFRHVCARCNGPHPAIACKGSPSGRGGHASSQTQKSKSNFRSAPY